VSVLLPRIERKPDPELADKPFNEFIGNAEGFVDPGNDKFMEDEGIQDATEDFPEAEKPKQ